MNSKPVGIGVSETAAYRPPKRCRWPHRIKSWPNSSGDWLANGHYNPVDSSLRRCFQLPPAQLQSCGVIGVHSYPRITKDPLRPPARLLSTTMQ